MILEFQKGDKYIIIPSCVNFRSRLEIVRNGFSLAPNPKFSPVVIIVYSINSEHPKLMRKYFYCVLIVYIYYLFLIQIVATDADTWDVISYSIVNGNDAGSFIINATTGEISTNSVLDFETTQVFYFLVEASDDSTYPRITNTLATIAIIDVNDNIPIFGEYFI